jgi:hypothetical protein
MCRTNRPTYLAYGFIIVCVRIKKLRQRIVPAAKLLLPRQE